MVLQIPTRVPDFELEHTDEYYAKRFWISERIVYFITYNCIYSIEVSQNVLGYADGHVFEDPRVQAAYEKWVSGTAPTARDIVLDVFARPIFIKDIISEVFSDN